MDPNLGLDSCLTGCVTTGQHRTDCPGGKCRGCLPRDAEHGNLCAWCWNRLTDAIGRIPSLVEHLRVIGEPHAQAAPLTDDRTSPADPAESTVMPAAWLDADELLGLVTSWAQLVIEEHPVQPMRGPNSAPWHGDVVAWIGPHLAWCAEQQWAAEMRRELGEYVTTLRHKWPTADDVEPPRTLDMPCPRCDMLALTYTPPRYKGQAFRVECTDPDCARVYSEDEWDQYKALSATGRRVAA